MPTDSSPKVAGRIEGRLDALGLRPEEVDAKVGLPAAPRADLDDARRSVSVAVGVDRIVGMFTVDEATSEAIRRAVGDGGELAGVVELRRYFPLLTDNAHARRCVQVIVGWTPLSDHSRKRVNTTARRTTKRHPKG